MSRPYEVIYDACGTGLGAVLLQDGRDIAFDGKRMSPAKHALELWRCYLDGVEFTVVTDHNPNTFFATKT